jgi:hypothetical protein
MFHVKTVDGHNINDGTNYRASGRFDLLPAAKTVFIEQEQADAVDSGAWTVEPRTVPITIRIRNHASRDTLIAQLKEWFKRGAEVVLVATASEDSVDYQLTCRVVSLLNQEGYPLVFTVLMQSGQTAWRSVALQTDSASLTTTGGNKVITVGGNYETRLNVTFTPTSGPTTGFLYQKLYRLPNVPGVDFGFDPWCLEIDHAALVSGAKSQADGDDLRIFINGVETPRWLSGTNTATCKIWFNRLHSAGYSLTLGVAVDSSTDVPYIEFQNTANNKTALAKIPRSGILYHGTEWMQYDGINTSTRRATITKRGVLGTTKQAHSAADAFVYIQNVIMLVYGNSSVSAPSTNDSHYDDTKPLFSLSSSDNTQWVYDTATLFRDVLQTGRTGAWTTAEKKSGTVTKLYDVTQDAESGNPALGQKIGTYPKGSGWVADNATLRHLFYRACGLNEITMTGQKYRNNNGWPATAKLEKSKDGKTWAQVFAEGKPTNADSWTAWSSHSNVSLGSGMKWLSLTFAGSFSGVDQYAMQECQTATVEFVTANLPTGSLGSETSNAYLSVTTKNTENNDQFDILGPLLLNKSLVMDGENFTILYDSVNAHDIMRLDDESRSPWIRLKAGQTNTLNFSSSDLGSLSVSLSWYRRRV